ncbi:hypothetical protein L0U88_06450 [Flavihumibacter sp. RY-1]|uniref:F0F1-ATPase subunit (Ca2+/Mg2+ transporter) n=1 Tax=Flavihumibacter fluminis TaxID=2909236 RepID=A0ABS9BGR9_9BACT|nr:hypothetical protein [Flavihumibacter fluminis]MCF1714263.1 hypothetical protein [Flavihumibacter fluminis]
MAYDSQNKRRKQYSQMRSILDYGMGGLILLFGFFFLFSEKLGFEFEMEPFFKYFFSGLCIVYGAWRIYRGYQKNYYSE